VIDDVNSSKMLIVDNLEKVHSFVDPRKGESDSFSPEIKKVLLSWETHNQKTKLQHFAKLASHQLNFFIFKKDPEFFNQVVRPFINSKIEHTLIDHYLLGFGQPVSDSHNLVVLGYLEKTEDCSKLNRFETSLILQVGLKLGNESQKTTARNLLKQTILIF
jgi:hypothetical protein